jgi:hypothetical protein
MQPVVTVIERLIAMEDDVHWAICWERQYLGVPSIPHRRKVVEEQVMNGGFLQGVFLRKRKGPPCRQPIVSMREENSALVDDAARHRLYALRIEYLNVVACCLR